MVARLRADEDSNMSGAVAIKTFITKGEYSYAINKIANENIKKSYAKLGNPFQRGVGDNLRRLFRRDKRNWRAEEEIVVSKQELMPLRK